MLRKRKIKYISILVIISLIITLCTPCDFISYAESMDYVKEAFENIANNLEEIDETYLDQFDTKSPNDWNTATVIDHLPRNFFHICVQLQICKKYDDILKELRIYYSDEDYGSADLYFKNLEDSLIYLWEVKPITYRWGENKAKAEGQLDGYVYGYNNCNKNSNKFKAVLGNEKIINDSMMVRLFIPRGGGVEEVVYKINWYNEGGGLILYTFERYSNGVKKQEEP